MVVSWVEREKRVFGQVGGGSCCGWPEITRVGFGWRKGGGRRVADDLSKGRVRERERVTKTNGKREREREDSPWQCWTVRAW